MLRIRYLIVVLSLLITSICLNSHALGQLRNKTEIVYDYLVLSDQTKLAVQYFKPMSENKLEKFPIVLEMLPYRMYDTLALRDEGLLTYFAEQGIAFARVDLRGTGASYGHLPEREYSDIELTDIKEVIHILSQLPWSNGNIGMQGISWSAVNTIMTAMDPPPELKAGLAVHGSHDLYGNDVHYIDGALHFDMYALEMELENALPRSNDFTKAQDYKLDSEYFTNRFETKPWLFQYLKNQRDGKFWQEKRALINHKNEIKIPLYVISGLLDGYRDFGSYIMQNSKHFTKFDIGPWNHAYPDNGTPGPNYEWRNTAVRWWKQWLNEENTGILDEQRFTFFLRKSSKEEQLSNNSPGHFYTANEYTPSSNLKLYYLNSNNNLSEKISFNNISENEFISYPGDCKGILNWWGEETGDMSISDENVLYYNSEPLVNDTSILGISSAELSVLSDKSTVNFIVKLEDVSPEGRVQFVTGGLINSAQRISREKPEYSPVNEFYKLNIPLHFTTWTFEKGHRIRLTIQNEMFPMIWPSKELSHSKIKISKGESILKLPIIDVKNYSQASLPEPIKRVDSSFAKIIDSTSTAPFSFMYDPETNLVTATSMESSSWSILNTKYRVINNLKYQVEKNRPEISTVSGHGMYEIDLGKRFINLNAFVDIQSDSENFYATVTREIYENGNLVKRKQFKETFPRDFQ